MKKLISACAAAIALAVGLQGCNLDVPPISAATYAAYAAGSPGPHKELTSAQLRALGKWLAEHRSEWSRTATTHVPRMVVSIQHEGGETSSLNIWPRLLIASGSFGQYQRSLSEAEARTLAEILGP
jgi:hypothetical protein